MPSRSIQIINTYNGITQSTPYRSYGSLETVQGYSELLPRRIELSTPEGYGNSLNDYYQSLLERAGSMIPGGFDRERAPRYREIFGQTQIRGSSIPDFPSLPLEPPEPPNEGTPPNSPPQLIPAGRTLSHIDLIVVGKVYTLLQLTDTEGQPYFREESSTYTNIFRLFFRGSQNTDLWLPNDQSAWIQPGEWFDMGNLPEGFGGTTNWDTTQLPGDSSIGDFSINQRRLLRLGYEGVFFNIFFLEDFQFTNGRTGNREGDPVLAGYRLQSLNYAIHYNDPPPTPRPPRPPRRERPMPQQCGCSCSSIAGMLIVQATVQTAINGSLAAAQTQANAIMIGAATAVLLGAELMPDVNINVPSPFSLLGRSIPISSAFQNISAIVQALVNSLQPSGQGGETPQQVDLRPVLDALQDLTEDFAEQKLKIQKTLNILGGEDWFSSAQSTTPDLSFDPEATINARRTGIYSSDDANSQDVRVSNLLGLISALQAVTYHRSGFHQLPFELPATLLGYTDSSTQPYKAYDNMLLQAWFVRQLDALVGKFPIEIEIEDADPTSEGNQNLKIELPNISEALAEMYGLQQTSATNSAVAINFLMRLTAELLAVKNSSIVTQDYVKANAAYLGYKGNPAKREVNYSFDFEHLDSLEKILKESKKYVVGWKNDDKETIAAYLMRLQFAAGVLKASLFRRPNQLEGLTDQIASMFGEGDTIDQDSWNAFLQSLNDPNSRFNTGDLNPQPKVVDRSTNNDPDNQQ